MRVISQDSRFDSSPVRLAASVPYTLAFLSSALCGPCLERGPRGADYFGKGPRGRRDSGPPTGMRWAFMSCLLPHASGERGVLPGRTLVVRLGTHGSTTVRRHCMRANTDLYATRGSTQSLYSRLDPLRALEFGAQPDEGEGQMHLAALHYHAAHTSTGPRADFCLLLPTASLVGMT